MHEWGLNEIDEDEVPIDEYPNSLIYSCLSENLQRTLEERRKVDYNELQTLTTISNLYIYTNPPPMGYGSPGPKVAESVTRAQKFNLKPNNREKKVGQFTVNAGYWEEEEKPYPFNEITGNWHPGETYKMLVTFKDRYREEIKEASERTLDYLINSNADVLTKGRQTWCSLTQSSVHSSVAFSNFMLFYNKNNMSENHSLGTLCASLHDLSKKEDLITYRYKKITKTKKKYDGVKMQTIKRRTIRKIKQTVRIRSSILEEIFGLTTSFCSYIKHSERGKLKRRAIASPNILLRAYLNIVEFFHLELCKKLPGTTISIGGDEKKQKILKEIGTVGRTDLPNQFTATQDATKFNECINADLLAFIHMVFFSYKDNPTETEQILLKMFLTSNFLLACKRITLGDGPICRSESGTFNRLDYHPCNITRFNKSTQKWIEELIDKFSSVYILAMPGMLMGMHNAAATTLSYLPLGYRQPSLDVGIKTLRSSDDSLTVYSCRTGDKLIQALAIESACLKMVGVNLATSKTFVISGIFGEYTSWYIQDKFISQYGTETSSLRPEGINPAGDFYSLAISSAAALAQQEINPIGAQMRILLGLNHVRRLWRITRKSRKEITPSVIFLSDGGDNPWTCMSSMLEETVIRKNNCVTEADNAYFQRCINPENIFTGEPKEEFHYDKELGTMTSSIAETPRTVFHFLQRHNRTFRGPREEESKHNRASVNEALKIIETANPALRVITIQNNDTCANFVANKLHDLARRETSELTEDERELISAAITRLMGEEIEDILFEEEDILDTEEIL